MKVNATNVEPQKEKKPDGKPAAKKLTAAELLQTNKFWIVVIVILFLVFLSMNSNANQAKNRLTVQLSRATSDTERLETAVAELKAELEEQARIDSVIISNEEEELARNDAKKQGAMVAYLQNKFSSFAVGDPDSIEKSNANKEELDPYFSEDAKRIGKGAWYPFLGAGIPGEWEFATNASFKGDTAKVLWFFWAKDPANPDDHSLLAYCTAVYHVSDGLFYDVEVKTTAYAEANSGGEEELVKPNNDETSIADQLKELEETFESTTPSADEDYTNETIGGRDEYKDKVANGEIEDQEFDDRYLPGLRDDSDSSSESADPASATDAESESSAIENSEPETDEGGEQ